MPVYDYIKIRGCPSTPPDDAPPYFELFTGIGGASLTTGDVNVTAEGGGGDDDDTLLPPPRTEISTSPEVALTIWATQATVITRQTAYLGSIKRELAARWEDLPAKLKAGSLKEEAITEFVKWIGAGVATYFWGPAAGELVKSGITLIAIAARLLKAMYNEGEALCDAMIAENGALADLERSLENYRLRSQIITQHDATINNLLTRVAEGEQRLIGNTSLAAPAGAQQDETLAVLTEMSETLKLIQAEDNIVQCPHTGDCIYTKSLVMDDEEIDP